MRVEAVCSLAAVEELFHLGKLVHAAKRHPLPGRQTLRVELSGCIALADALMMTPSMRAEAKGRSFRRGAETRHLVENVKSDEGRTIYVLDRLRATGEARIASRETEVFEGRLRSCLSSFDVKVVKAEEVPGLPESYPGNMNWTESRHGEPSAMGGHHLSAGNLVLAIPVSVVLGKAADLADLIKV